MLRVIEEQKLNTEISHGSNESRLISYYKADYSFMMESLLIAMKGLKAEMASMDTSGQISIHISEQYLLVNLDDKNIRWIEVQPNENLTRLSVKSCNLHHDNTAEYRDSSIDIQTIEYTNVQAVLDFLVDCLAKGVVNLR